MGTFSFTLMSGLLFLLWEGEDCRDSLSCSILRRSTIILGLSAGSIFKRGVVELI